VADLARFVTAQDGGTYEQALDELRRGQKRSHWMWFVFPQIVGLGRSETARFYAIADLDEATAYLAHPVLAPRLTECTSAMLAWAGRKSALAILSPIDALKFASSMTLFEAAAEAPRPFAAALEAFNDGERDQATLARL
jgi:uncharacterized protein (DUF1810 family)